jgi:hypothetical protein
MIKLLNNSKLVARNSHRPEIKLSQSVMVGLLGGLYYAASRGSIVQACTFAVTGFFTIRVPVYKNSTRLFSTSPSYNNNKFSYEVAGKGKENHHFTIQHYGICEEFCIENFFIEATELREKHPEFPYSEFD